MYRTAIVGCGPRAVGHALAYQHVTSGRLEACCDLDEQRLEEFGERFGISGRHTDLSTMMDAVQPDLVHVTTAPWIRWSVIEAILHRPPRGILVEKPLSNRPAEGYRLLDACARAGVALFVNHQLRHHASWRRVRTLLMEEAVGPIRFVRASCRGNLLEQGTHLFDLVDFLLGDAPAPTQPSGDAELPESRPAAVPWLVAQATGADGFAGQHSAPSYAAGVLAPVADWHVSFECGPEAPPWPGDDNFWLQFGIEIYGADGRVGCSLNRGWWLQTPTRSNGEETPYGQADLLAEARLIDTILQSLDDPSQHPNNAARSKVSFDLVMAAQRAALRHARVSPREPVQDAEIEALRAALEEEERRG